MFTLKITGDNGFDGEVVAKPRHLLVFERATGIKLGDIEDQISMETFYKLAHLVMKIQHPDETPAKLAEFEKTFDVLPLDSQEEEAGPTNAAP